MSEAEELLAHFAKAKCELLLAKAAVEAIDVNDFSKMEQLVKIARDTSLETGGWAFRKLAERRLGQIILHHEEQGR